jgi:hypothetical protein
MLRSLPASDLGVGHHPVGEGFTIQVPSGEGQHSRLGSLHSGGQLKSIEYQGGFNGGMADVLVPVHDPPCLHCVESGDCAAPAPRPSAANASSQASVEILVLLKQPLRGSLEIGGQMSQQIPYS